MKSVPMWSSLNRTGLHLARRSLSSTAPAGAKSYDSLPIVPGGWPLIGSYMKINAKPHGQEKGLHNVIKYKKQYDPDNIGLLRFHSPFLNRAGDGRLLFVFDPKDIEVAYRHEGPHPSRGSGLFGVINEWRKTRKDLFPVTNGVLFEEGKKWHEIRHVINPDMMRPAAALFYIDQLQDVCEDFVALCRERRDPVTLLAPDDHIGDYNKFAIEAISLVALNTRLNCLVSRGSTTPENRAIMDAIKTSMGLAGEILSRFPFYLIVGKLDPRYRKLAKYSDIVGDFIKARIREVQERIKNKPEDDQGETSILEKLINKAGPDSTIPFVTAFDMVVAGADTTGNSLGFLMYNLANNPDAQEKLREEIHTATKGEKHVTKKALAEMNFLRASMKESMRMLPLLRIFVRLVPSDVEIKGYRIPKNTMICWCPQIIGMDETVYEDPMSFKPERWLRVNKGKIHPFANLPFSYGPRGCLGKRFAELEIQLLTIKMLQNFRLEWPEAKGKVDTSWKFINRPDKPLNIKFIDL